MKSYMLTRDVPSRIFEQLFGFATQRAAIALERDAVEEDEVDALHSQMLDRGRPETRLETVPLLRGCPKHKKP